MDGWVACVISAEAIVALVSSTGRYASLRKEYETLGIDPEDMADDPFAEFQDWFEGATRAEIDEPNACVLATTGSAGIPTARAVLIKDFDRRGLVFYTNLQSQKSQDLGENPRAAITFVWTPIHRQVRFGGVVQLVSDKEADSYFSTRPRGAQLAAHASEQSSVVASREVLEQALESVAENFRDGQVPRPSNWGGWRLVPDLVEFWQGRPNRFHDRVRYRLSGSDWVKERLAP